MEGAKTQNAEVLVPPVHHDEHASMYIEYTGVQSREQVLRHINEKHPVVISLDTDIDVPNESTTHAPAQGHTWRNPRESVDNPENREHVQLVDAILSNGKRPREKDIGTHNEARLAKSRRSNSHTDALIVSKESDGHLFAPMSAPRPSEERFRRLDAIQHEKKCLFSSEHAKKNMAKISSLPSSESLTGRNLVNSNSAGNPFTAPLRLFMDESSNSSGQEYLSPQHLHQHDDEPRTTVSEKVPPVLENSKQPNSVLDGGAGDDRTRSSTNNQQLPACRQTTPADIIMIDDIDESVRPHTQSARRPREQDPSQFVSESSDPECLDEAFDILINHVRTQSSDLAATNLRQRAPDPRNHRSRELNPLSRRAAEMWRTQGRHLDHLPNTDTRSSTIAGSRAVENVLDRSEENRIKARVADMKTKSFQKMAFADREAEKRLLGKKFHSVDLQTGSKKTSTKVKQKPVPKTPSDIQGDLQKIMGTAGFSSTKDLSEGGESGSSPSGSHQSPLPPSMLLLEQLSSDQNAAGSKATGCDRTESSMFDNLPEQGDLTEITLPKGYHEFNDDQKRLFSERAIKLERLKDLELLIDLYKLGARLGSLEGFDLNDRKTKKDFTDLNNFAQAILTYEKSAKPIRNHVRALRESFKRRLEKCDTPLNGEAVDRRLADILRQEFSEKLQTEKPILMERLSYLDSECSKIRAAHKKKRVRKRNSSAKISPSRKLHSLTLSTTENQLAGLYAARAQFDKTSQNQMDESEVINLGSSVQDEGDVSEEDEGEDFTRPSGFHKRGQGVAENDVISTQFASKLQKEQPVALEQPFKHSQATQRADPLLLASMVTKQQQQQRLDLQGAQRPDLQINQENRQRKAERVAADNEPALAVVTTVEEREEKGEYNINQEEPQEFDDSDLDASCEDEDYCEDGDSDDEPQCKRYVAKGICFGLSSNYDNNEHLLGNFLNRSKARDKVLAFAAWTKQQISRCRPELNVDGFNESTSETRDSFEQKVVFGDHEEVVSRAWLEEELYNPSEDAYNKAKVYKACQAPEIWFVDWERIIEPYNDMEEDENGDRGSATVSESSKVTVATDAIENKDELEITNEDSNRTTDQSAAGDMGTKQPSAEGGNSSSSLDSTKSASACDAEDLTSNALANVNSEHEDPDDLFGPDDPEPVVIPQNLPTPPPTDNSSISSQHRLPPRPDPIVNRANGDQIRFFSNRALANRHAKNVFMHWYIERLPGRENQGFICHEDEMMEEDLRRMGDRSCWSRDENFVETNADGAKVLDSLRVWVRKGRSRGPSN